MPRITPCLWFDREAEEAMNHYVSIFPNSRVVEKNTFKDAGPSGKDTVVTVAFELDGQPFMGLNGGPGHPFTQAISLSVSCKDQAEVDHYWSGLLEGGGTELPCAWLKDRYGLHWQIVPRALKEALGDPDPAAAKRSMDAMLKMKKIDVAAIERARRGA